MPRPAASLGRETVDVAGAAAAGGNFGCSSTAVLDVRSVADGAGEADDTSVTVSLCRMISIASPAVNGSGAVGAGVSRASFAASSIVSRSCCGAHGLVRNRKTSLSLIEPSTASRSA